MTATISQKFSTAGTFTWVAPTGVSSISVQCWGSGAGGGIITGGGGGGEYAAELSNTATPGNSYTVVVGAAGTAGTSGAGGNGNSSSFTGTGATTVTAHGGSANASGGAGGVGGTGSANTTHFNGGTGGVYSVPGAGSTGGPGGGGSGGTGSAGNAGGSDTAGVITPGAGATAVTGGGPGGTGGAGTAGAGGAAAPAVSTGPGGGGGTGGAGSSGFNNGAAGFAGQVVISWSVASPALFTANGTFTWTAPVGVTSVLAEAWGAGGAGGGATSTTSTTGGGAGGGEYAAEPTLAVTAGSSYTAVIGKAGAGAAGTTGGTGGNSTFAGDSVTVTAHGGTGGLEGTNGSAGAAGTGSTNTTHHDGGGGAAGVTNTRGGGGGSSGGSGASGNAGSGSSGGTAPTNGGAGGAGATVAGNGSAPVAGPGGGGGGARGGTSTRTGGAGFDGQIQLTWAEGPHATGGINVKKPSLAGTAFKGTLTSGSVNVKKPRLAGTEERGNVTTGSMHVKKPGMSGHISLGPHGGINVKKPSLSGSGKVGRVVSGGPKVKKPGLSGTGKVGRVASGGLHVKKPSLLGTEHETYHATGGIGVKKPSLSGFGLIQVPFPPGPLGLLFEIMVGADWTDITDFVYQRQSAVIQRGRPDETQAAQPATLSFVLDNRDGRFSPRNPLSPYYGLIGRNTQVRVSAPLTGTAPWVRGYRFWGEISEWPPSWDVTGADVYVTISASGILRRLSQSAALGSSLTRYYSTLATGATPLAYWPCEDGSAATSLASGVSGGFAMMFVGNPQLASDSGFSAASALPTMNGAVFTGPTGAAGALAVANTTVFSSTGTYIPAAGITSVLVEAWGAGGGGSGFNGATGGAGGGGGEYASGSVAVTPGSSYTATVGSSSVGGTGGNSVFTGNSGASVTAHGGHAGASGGATGGAGGTGSAATVHFDGGAGAAGSGGAGGGGTDTSGTGSQSFTSSGTFTAPSDISGNSTFYIWGGGGGGGAGTSGTHGGGSGGGGGFTSASVSVAPNASVTVTVGAGGTGGSSGTSSTDGSTSAVSGHTAGGGTRGTASGFGSGGSGSTHTGGSGGFGSSSNLTGSGGGGGASLGGNGAGGINGSGGGAGGNGGGAGGLDTAGGDGGNGGTSGSHAGQSGSAPGGGGGGGYGTGPGNGGNGARGKVEVFYNTSDVGPAPDAAIAGGGGSSGGSASAGNAGDVQAGGAAVTGGGPGGGTLAGSRFTAAPSSAPGGGGGGYDSLGAVAAGAKGQVRLTYAVSGSGSAGITANVLRFLLHLPAESTADGAVIARMFTTGTVAWIDVIYNTGGFLTLTGFGPAGSSLFTTGEVAFNADGQFMLVSAEMVASSGNINYKLTGLIAGQDSAAATSTGTLISGTLGDPFSIVMNPNGTLTDTAFGHVAVLETTSNVTDLITPVAAHAGETAADRFSRLCMEENVPVSIVGTAADTEKMGPQLPEKLVTLLQECEDADRGLLFENKDAFGLSYRTRVDLYNQAPAITLIYTNGDLADSLQPTEDDQFTRNDVTASRPNGSSSEQILTSGSLSVLDPPDGVGAYTFSQSVNVQTDGQLPDIANWMLGIGTVDEPRYPTVNLDLIRMELADNFSDITGADIGDFLTVQNPPPWLPPGAINQLIYGYTETLNAFQWDMSMNCVPESPYEVAEAGDEARADTDGSNLHDGIGTGDTTFNVTSPSPNAVWVDTTGYPDEFPFDITITGEQMTVTAISGTTSPQMFTVTRQVNGISKIHNAGESVTLAEPAIIAL